MAKLEKLYTYGEDGERDCAINCIEAILDTVRLMHKVYARNPNKTIMNELCHPGDAIYFNASKLFIPEKIISEVFTRESYLEVSSIEEILVNTRYNFRRIVPEELYRTLHVLTPVDNEKVKCMVFEYKILRRIASDLMIGV